MRLATASCQHFETGFYAAHRDIAEWAPDLVVFLGDFIYEGAANPIGDGRVRSHDGPEPMDLAGYRARYATYLADEHLQASRAACPWLVIWDDHEVENNYAGLVPQDAADAAGFADTAGDGVPGLVGAHADPPAGAGPSLRRLPDLPQHRHR